MPSPTKRKLIVIGDRVLIEPEDKEQRTQVGLYLPQTVVEKEQVQGGWVVSVGPGIPLPDPGSSEDEPWQRSQNIPKFLPMQVEEGDYALFLKKSSVEIKWEEKKYLILPQSAILVILRDSMNISEDDEEDLDIY
ncbi:co-chaperone GroES [candidate division KSB1 bacterium]|nr:co-chaperone GroES [candidate division KSB1 bacterium]